MNFYVLARRAPQAQRLLTIYQRRLRANLTHALRPAIGVRAAIAADRIAALIDGVYLQQSLGRDAPDGSQASAQVLGYLDLELERARA